LSNNIKKIKRHVYFSGNVQSLEFLTPDGKKATIGVIMPGEYNFGTAKQKETISVLQGMVFTKEGSLRPGGYPIVFEPGTKIIFSCPEPVAYLCLYG